MLLHRIRQRRAAFDVAASRENDLREVLVLFLRAEDLETLHERQAGVDHDRELAREDRQVLRVRPFCADLAWRPWRRFLDRVDLRDEDLLAAQRGDRRVHRFGDALAGDVLPGRVRPLYANVAIYLLLHHFREGSRLAHAALPRHRPAGSGRPRPAPATTPTPRLIMSCSSSRFDDAIIAVSSVISSF